MCVCVYVYVCMCVCVCVYRTKVDLTKYVDTHAFYFDYVYGVNSTNETVCEYVCVCVCVCMCACEISIVNVCN